MADSVVKVGAALFFRRKDAIVSVLPVCVPSQGLSVVTTFSTMGD